MTSLDPALNVVLAGLLGLLVGSFLNVAIHRIPKMLELQWKEESLAFFASSRSDNLAQAHVTTDATFNLFMPRSHCPACGHQIKWYENIPVVSWALLRGSCSSCKASISFRYPLVELITGILFAFCAWQWGLTLEAAAWCAFAAAVVTLTFIDWDTTLLPDNITLPLVWAGLAGAWFGITQTSLADSVMGAMVGYLSLWSIYWLFKLATGKEGMGYGDFKLFAAMGAWFGWKALLPIILLASIVGTVIGIAIKMNNRLREGGYVPFGPFLALGGLTCLLLGPDTVLGWLNL